MVHQHPSDRVGAEPVEEVLRDLARAAADCYEQSFPMAASLFSEPNNDSAGSTGTSARRPPPTSCSAPACNGPS